MRKLLCCRIPLGSFTEETFERRGPRQDEARFFAGLGDRTRPRLGSRRLIRGHFVRIERPRFIEIAWGEAGSDVMPPGATRLRVTFLRLGDITRVELEHTGLVPAEAAKHALGWPHFMARLGVAAAGGDPGPDPWKTSPPAGGVQE
jgi:uncharacterized protein YndB with AHSA1/START domain